MNLNRILRFKCYNNSKSFPSEKLPLNTSNQIIVRFVNGEEKRPVVEKKVVEKKRNETPNYYVDPWTGHAIDLNKLQKSHKKKECMEVAKLLPADDRLELLRGCGLID